MLWRGQMSYPIFRLKNRHMELLSCLTTENHTELRFQMYCRPVLIPENTSSMKFSQISWPCKDQIGTVWKDQNEQKWFNTCFQTTPPPFTANRKVSGERGRMMDQSCIVPTRWYGNLGTLMLQLQGCHVCISGYKGGTDSFHRWVLSPFLSSDSLGVFSYPGRKTGTGQGRGRVHADHHCSGPHHDLWAGCNTA